MTRMIKVMAVGVLLWTGLAEAGPRRQLQGVANINGASVSELSLLPGIGKKTAERIVLFRQKSPFHRIEELVKVKGFGKKRFEKMKGYLSVAGPTTLKAIGPAQARTGQKPHPHP